LINDIFEQRRYVKYARPVLQETDALNVEFGISLQQIIDVVSPLYQRRSSGVGKVHGAPSAGAPSSGQKNRSSLIFPLQ